MGLRNKWKSWLSVFALMMVLCTQLVNAAILYDGADTGGVTTDDTFVIDYDLSSAGNRNLQFGDSSIFLRWDGGQFQLSNDLDLNSNEIKSARVENVTALPGEAGGLGAEGTGRIVQLTTTDAIAPGCIAPTCQPGAYVWNGGIWIPLTGTITAATASKIVTVGPLGRDYTNIADAAAYLNTLSGGEMWIDPGSYPIVNSPNPVNLSNIRLMGTDSGITTVTITGGNTALVNATDFVDMIINVDAGLTNLYAFDLQHTAGVNSALEFDHVDIKVGTGKFLFDSSSGTAPTGIITFKDSTQSGTAGSIVRAQGTANLNAASAFTVINQLGKNPIKISNWPVKIIGGGNVVTSGIIDSVPDRTILVSPGMNIQGAINSLGSQGGVVKLLIGTHDISNSLFISNNNIQLTGEGPGTILRAPSGTWVGGVTIDDAVIQVGTSNGASPRSNIVVNSFKIEIGPNIHGIQVNGGTEIKVIDMTVTSTGVKSGGRVGILFTDGSATTSSRFTLTRSIVTTDLPANRWVDGVHMDGDASFAGLYGYGNGISDSIISEVIVNEAQETSFAFASVSASSIFSNRARNLGFNAGALAMFVTNSFDIIVMNNTFEGNNNATSIGLRLQSNVDDSIFIGNIIRGGPQNFASAININANTCERNIFSDNIIQNATNRITDNGLYTKLETNHIRATVDPTVNDDSTKGYSIGTLWINTTGQRVYALLDSSTGAAVWLSLSGGVSHTQNTDTGTTSNSFVLDTDNTGGDVYLQFGTTLNERLRWNAASGRFDLTNDLYIEGTLGIIEGGTAPTFYTILQGGDQSADIIYTLPATQGGANTVLSNSGTGTLNWASVTSVANITNLFAFLSVGTAEQWRNMPAALTEFDDDTNRRVLIDLTNATQARLGANLRVAGANTAVLAIQYSLDQNTWNYLDGGTGPSMSINTTGLSNSAFATITPAARTNVYLRVVGSGGNGTADPTFMTIHLEVK